MSPGRGGNLTLTQRDRRFGYLLTAPGLAVLVVVITFPLIFTIFTSFHDYTLLTPNHDGSVAAAAAAVEGRGFTSMIGLWPSKMQCARISMES